MESGDDEPHAAAKQMNKSDMMKQLDFWGITASVLEQVTTSRAPKVGVLRPFYTVAQGSLFNYLDRSWDDVHERFRAHYDVELPEEVPVNREAVVLEWASRCFKTSACMSVPERKTADEPTPKAGDKSSHGAGDNPPGLNGQAGHRGYSQGERVVV